MKKIETILALAALLVLSSCNLLEKGKTVYHILNVDPEYISLKVGEYVDLSVVYSYYDSEHPDHVVTPDDFKYSVSDEKVAKVEVITKDVEYEGNTYSVTVPRVTALSAGTAVLVATVDETSATAFITVKESTDEKEIQEHI